tara:strand:+ start:3376 stop:3504 length:129 start_codon:yes stop_codon:yes gene_type:complete
MLVKSFKKTIISNTSRKKREKRLEKLAKQLKLNIAKRKKIKK